MISRPISIKNLVFTENPAFVIQNVFDVKNCFFGKRIGLKLFVIGNNARKMGRLVRKMGRWTEISQTEHFYIWLFNRKWSKISILKKKIAKTGSLRIMRKNLEMVPISVFNAFLRCQKCSNSKMSTFEVLRYDEVRLNYVTINTEGIFTIGSEFLALNSKVINGLFVSAVF